MCEGNESGEEREDEDEGLMGDDNQVIM